jgi:predicted metal-dependent hydrolase
MNYPTLERMKEVEEQSQLLGEFLEWLHSKYFMIDKKSKFETANIPFGFDSIVDIEKLLAKYFNIDLAEAEKERLQILNGFKNK